MLQLLSNKMRWLGSFNTTATAMPENCQLARPVTYSLVARSSFPVGRDERKRDWREKKSDLFPPPFRNTAWFFRPVPPFELRTWNRLTSWRRDNGSKVKSAPISGFEPLLVIHPWSTVFVWADELLHNRCVDSAKELTSWLKERNMSRMSLD